MERTLKQLVVASACSKMWDVVDVYYTKEDITRIVSEETAEGIKFRISRMRGDTVFISAFQGTH